MNNTLDYENKIFQLDCNVFMKQLPAESIDLCIADFPYNVSNYEMATTRKGDSVVRSDFGDWDKFETQDDYLDWVFKTCLEIKRVLKPYASAFFFFAMRQAGWIAYELDMRELFAYKSPIIFNKQNFAPSVTKLGFRNAFEHAVWMINCNESYVNNYSGTVKSRVFNFLTQQEMTNVMSYTPSVKETTHPNEKPARLINRMIRILSDEGEIVLDPFMGSGCTAVEAMKLRRKFVGTELDSEYYKMCIERIEQEKRGQRLF